MSSSYAAFLGNVCIARGDLPTVTRAAHQAQDSQTEMPIVFDDATGLVMDLDLRGSVDEALRRLRSASSPKDEPHEHSEAKRSRGRPKLGVTAREVTLLPKHWAWLNRQTGGASAALRRLVEQAAKDNANIDRVRDAQEAVYKVMYALGGHLPGYEGALRALYALDEGKFKTYLVSWPHDVKAYLDDLSRHAFSSGTSA